MSIAFGADLSVVASYWTTFKSTVSSRSLLVQYQDTDNEGSTYTIFGFDGPLAFTCTIWKGTVPPGVITGGYSQAQNDTDKTDFETNYKPTANARYIANTSIAASSSSAVTSVAASASSVTLLATNTSRKGAMIVNDGAKNLFVKFGTTASTTSYTVKLIAGSFFEVPFSYTGIITGIWDVVVGGDAARVTELT